MSKDRTGPMKFSEAERELIAKAVAGTSDRDKTPREIVDEVLGLLSGLRDSERNFDASGIPTAACPNCGDRWMKVPMQFDDETYDVSMWGLEGECYGCGTLITVCCPTDKEQEGMEESG